MTRKMPFSLPGMMRELRMTVSPASILACLWLSTAARLSALMGSPCVPLMRIINCSGAKSRIWPGLMTRPGGMSM